MADQVSTFKAVCRGGLNTGSDVLSLGEEASGAATQLINYEPNLEGGYRKINGYSHGFGTVTGTGSVLGVTVANGIKQGVFGCRTPSSGNNYLHFWNFYYSMNVGSDTNLDVGQTLKERTTASDSSTQTSVTGTLKSKDSNTIIVDFGRLPSSVFTNGNHIADDDFASSGGNSTNISSVPAVVGWTEITCDVIADDRDGVSASASISAGDNAVIGGDLASGGSVNFVTAASEQPRQVTVYGSGNESGRTLTVTGTDDSDAAQVDAITGPNNSTVSTTKYFKTVTSVSVSIPVQVIVKAGGDESGRTFTITGTNSEDATITEEVTGPNSSTSTTEQYFKTVTQIAVDAATAGAIEVGTASDDNAICTSQTPSSAGNLTLTASPFTTAAATVGSIEVGSGTGQYRQSNPTMTGVSKVRFTEINFGTPKIVLTDGINPAATYDGTDYIQITDSNAPTDPTMSAEFQNHLFLAGDPTEVSNLYFSAPTAERDFDPANGAGVINVGFEIVAIKKFRNVLYIFGKNNIKRLVGENSANFRLETVTSNLGCLATDSVVELGGDLLFLAPDGIRPIGGTNKIGDVNLETVSKNIQQTIKNLIADETLTALSSVIIRAKSQFRYIFSSTTSNGLIGALREYQGKMSFEFGQLSGLACTCVDSGYIETEEFVIHGDSSGKVFRQESGNAFDTGNIVSIYKTPFVYMENPEQRKNYYSVSTYLSAEGEHTINLGVSYDYEKTDVLTPSNVAIDNDSPAAFYDSGNNIAVFDTTDIFDGNPSPVESSSFSGSGKAVSFKYVTDDTKPSHSVQGYTVTYGIGDVR